MLLEWVEPMQKFMFLKVSLSISRPSAALRRPARTVTSLWLRLLPTQNIDFPLPCPLEVFEMLVVPEQQYPLICMAVSKGSGQDQVVRFETVNPSSTSSWFIESGGCTGPQPKAPRNGCALRGRINAVEWGMNFVAGTECL